MRFVEVTPATEHLVDALSPGAEAEDWVYANRYWLTHSRARPDIAARLIYMDEYTAPVGFIALGPYYADKLLTHSIPGWYELIHLVIDAPFQQRGYGRQATRLAIEWLKAQPDCQTIVIAYNPDNTVAQRLYASLGFTELVGQNYDDDPLLKLVVE